PAAPATPVTAPVVVPATPATAPVAVDVAVPTALAAALLTPPATPETDERAPANAEAPNVIETMQPRTSEDTRYMFPPERTHPRSTSAGACRPLQQELLQFSSGSRHVQCAMHPEGE